MLLTDRQTDRQYLWIDSLKGLAILMVIAVHIGIGEVDSPIRQYTNNGMYGVQIFFVISGYLTMKSYHRHIQHGDMAISAWLKRKLCRLIPGFYIACLFYTLVFDGIPYYLGEENGVSLLNFLAHITFTFALIPHYINSIIGVEWYLGLLVVYYVFVAVLGNRFVGIRKSIWLFILATLLYKFPHMLIYFLPKDLPDWYLYEIFLSKFNPFSQGVFFAAGVLLSEFKLARINDKFIDSMMKRRMLILLAITLLLLTTFNIIHSKHDLLYGLFAFVVILVNLEPGVSWGNNKFLAKFGKLSYEIYLSHFMIILLFNQWLVGLQFILGDLYFFSKYCIVIIASYIVSIVLKHASTGGKLLYENTYNRC